MSNFHCQLNDCSERGRISERTHSNFMHTSQQGTSQVLKTTSSCSSWLVVEPIAEMQLWRNSPLTLPPRINHVRNLHRLISKLSTNWLKHLAHGSCSILIEKRFERDFRLCALLKLITA